MKKLGLIETLCSGMVGVQEDISELRILVN